MRVTFSEKHTSNPKLLAQQLNVAFNEIQKTIPKSVAQLQQKVQQLIESSSIQTSPVSDYHRLGSAAVVAGKNTIPFTSPLLGAYKMAVCYMIDAQGYLVDYVAGTSNLKTGSFDVTVNSTGTITYLAMVVT